MIIEKIVSKVDKIQSKIREKKKSKSRSPRWDEVRDEFLRKQPYCSSCHSAKDLQVHHIVPFHLRPELELSEENLIVLCMDEHNCHLSIGHGGSFRSFNPNVVQDAEDFLDSTKAARLLIIERAKRNRSKT